MSSTTNWNLTHDCRFGELERLHDLAENGDADERLNAADGIHLALPGLIAELRALRAAARVIREAVADMAPSDAYVYYTPQRDAISLALSKVPK